MKVNAPFGSRIIRGFLICKLFIMNTTETVKKTKTARNPESITKGALLLPLADRVILLRALKGSIDAEVKSLEAQFAEAKQIANGS